VELKSPVEILNEIKRIVAKTLRIPIERLTEDTRFEDLGVASIDVIEVLYEIEEKFGISIPIRPTENSLLLNSERPGIEPLELGFKTIAEFARAVKILVDAKTSS
jgi:acyl carrier protein